jgi:hypothetical protein
MPPVAYFGMMDIRLWSHVSFGRVFASDRTGAEPNG